MSGHGCPVLHELEVTEDYQPEHENPPVLSGGDYDISAIRDCAENCKAAARLRVLTIEHNTALALIADRAALAASRDECCAENCKAASLAWSRGDHLRSIALILGLAPGDTAEIDGVVRELIRSRDEWRDRAAANAKRIEELTRSAAGMHLALIRIVNGEATVAGMKAVANAALDQS